MSFSHSDTSSTATITNSEKKNTTNSDVVLECEAIFSQKNDQIHEGQISFTHGFVPHQPLMDQLPPEFKAWDNLAENLPRYITEGCDRSEILKLPLLDASDATKLPDQFLARVSAILGNAAHAYYYTQRKGFDQASDPLPDNIRLPWEQINARVGRKLPKYEPGKLKAIRGSYDAFLCNWKINDGYHIDGNNNGQITLDDLSIHMPMFKNNEERVFVLTILLMELRFAPALEPIMKAVQAVAKKDNVALLAALKKVTEVVESIGAALDYLSPNEHSKNYVDPTIWSKTIATFDGQIPGGLPGLSASVFPLFHTLDSFIERKEYGSVLGKAIVEKYEAQPQHVHDFIAALRRDLTKYSIRKYIEQAKDPLLTNQYQALIDAYLGDLGLTNIHSNKAYGYLKINFRSGRLETNGLQRGTATVETEEQRQTVKNFSLADAERKQNFIPQPYYATKIKVKTLSANASEVLLDISQTGLNFVPGDHCAIVPVNDDQLINSLLGNNHFHTVKLNPEWKQFFLTQLGMNVDQVEIRQLLKYVNIDAETKAHIVACNLDINLFHPVTPRLYSVATFVNQPKQIRLTVGRHFYDGLNKNKLEGKASGYLVHTTDSIHIDRSPARNFHLPANPATPILMFAAGTGISPFMGFINQRKNQPGGLSWLFFSTQTHDSFYYQDELREAVANDTLKLSVIFSREEVDTIQFNKNSNEFEFAKKYQGKHVDELIKENASEICKLIKSGAHVYVCGNNGFASTVQQAIKTALRASYTELSEAECDEYVHKLIANHQYHYDAFTPSHSEQSKNSKQIYRSEVAYHNKENDCWMIINGCVYDLSKFIHVHPGGRKILHINGGMDASGDYNSINHKSPQIEALLLQNQVGVLAKLKFNHPENEQVYNKCIQYIEALLEMSNTLSNSTVFVEKKTPLYLWREVFGILVQGRLNNYEGKGNIGSLKYVFGSLLSEFSEMSGASKDYFNVDALFQYASNCAEMIRHSTIESSPDKIAKIKRINTVLISETMQFIERIKRLVIEMAKKLEAMTGHSLPMNAEVLSGLMTHIQQEIVAYNKILQNVQSALKMDNKPVTHTLFSAPVTGGVCPFGFGRQEAIATQPPAPVVPAQTVVQQPQPQAASPIFSFTNFVNSSMSFIATFVVGQQNNQSHLEERVTPKVQQPHLG